METSTRLSKAILLGDADLFERLIRLYFRKNCLKERIHHNQDEALRMACRCGNLRAVKRLVALGADIHASRDAPYIEAAKKDHVDVVKYLLKISRHRSRDRYRNLLRYRFEGGHRVELQTPNIYFGFPERTIVTPLNYGAVRYNHFVKHELIPRWRQRMGLCSLETYSQLRSSKGLFRVRRNNVDSRLEICL